MCRSRTVVSLALGAWFLGVGSPGPSEAQGPAGAPGAFKALEDLNASHARRLLELDRRHVADLAALAARSKGPEADAAYAQLLQLAVARGLSADAAAAAEQCLASKTTPREVRGLASLVRLLAKADKGGHDQALPEVKAMLEEPAKGLDAPTTMAVAEAYLQRVIRDGRYDVARAICECACDVEDAPAALKEHFEARMGRLELLGKAAPAIAGPDVDGKKVALADLKGKVVLVDFWATWCPPCVAAIPRLNALAEKYRDRGFEILGVNVDAKQEGGKDPKSLLAALRLFLATHGATWTNLVNGEGPGDATRAYGVAEIPANFLIGRDGTVIALELSDDGLERAIARALGTQAEARGK